MSDIAITFAIIAAIVVLFVWDRLPVVLVALGTALALYATGVLDLGQALAGLGDPAVIFIAALFVVSAGLDATGVTAWAGQILIAGAGDEPHAAPPPHHADRRAADRADQRQRRRSPPSCRWSSSRRSGSAARPSQLLMPLVFAAHAGSLLALTGTPVNVLVSDAAVDAGLAPFGFFEFALVGIPLLLGTHGDHRAVRRSACCRIGSSRYHAAPT